MSRWELELLFKRFKQNQKIKTLLDTCNNGVVPQMWIALSTMLLVDHLKSSQDLVIDHIVHATGSAGFLVAMDGAAP